MKPIIRVGVALALLFPLGGTRLSRGSQAD